MSLHKLNICGPNERDKRCFKIEDNAQCGKVFAVFWKDRSYLDMKAMTIQNKIGNRFKISGFLKQNLLLFK